MSGGVPREIVLHLSRQSVLQTPFSNKEEEDNDSNKQRACAASNPADRPVVADRQHARENKRKCLKRRGNRQRAKMPLLKPNHCLMMRHLRSASSGLMVSLSP